jgi:hypothetical protein
MATHTKVAKSVMAGAIRTSSVRPSVRLPVTCAIPLHTNSMANAFGSKRVQAHRAARGMSTVTYAGHGDGLKIDLTGTLI